MRAVHRVAVLACAAALAGGAVPAADAMMHTTASTVTRTPASHQQVARLALDRLVAGGAVAGQRVDVAHLVRATVCFDGACVHRRLRASPTCDPSAGVCLGTAERAWKHNHFTVVVELA
jgi:hypothetical protein